MHIRMCLLPAMHTLGLIDINIHTNTNTNIHNTICMYTVNIHLINLQPQNPGALSPEDAAVSTAAD